MKKGYKYRLYPTKEHICRLEFTLELCRELYNCALDHRIQAWKRAKYSVTYLEQQNSLPQIKEYRAEYKEIYSQVLQDVLRRLDKNFKAFFKRGGGFPRFKGRNWYKSITYPQSGWGFMGTNRISISKIGVIKIKQHRPFPKSAILKTLTLKRELNNKWYAIISFEIPGRKDKVGVRNGVGIDVGITHFATLSDGTIIENLNHLSKSEAKLADTQRILSKKKKGTKARVAKIHRKIANQRTDFLHKVSRKLVDSYDLIAYEDLKIKDMMQYGNLAKSIRDCSWGKFLQYVSYKAENGGKYGIAVDPKGTSQICSNCGIRVPKKLSDRIHNCHQCHIILDRDHNASRNIYRLGLSLVPSCGTEAPAFSPGE
ncbi:MAG: RNA-guided endonuclease InsQ/TnpB family protein [Ignavibacteriales bacterium]